MRVLVTGAGGFLGRGLTARLADTLPQAKRIVLTDRVVEGLCGAGMETMAGDLSDPAFRRALLDPGFDLVFHLASIPGGLAEREQGLGLNVNLLTPIGLAEEVAAQRPGARLVFASSIAVYGDLGQDRVTDATVCQPELTYGAHKRMTEILLSDMTRRGVLSAISLRFPGLVARPATESGHGSAFMSQIFHSIAAGDAYTCPVAAESACWWMSRPAAVNILLHAAGASNAVPTVIQPPVLHESVGNVANAIARVTGQMAKVQFGDDATLQRIFGAMPKLDASTANSFGFQADLDLDALVKAALSGD
ncbi:NAD-dependent epimerase/dehydratase family protein [Rhizobium sp. FY34]|uniref:NAD-dependent epimerase/dehydratase family protein n=1 Tax=Rhizobium sp. FY34 TaxID=2562309 RepID=UPI0010BFAEE6|nr:NAD-dependent epimerase/dehydratase family protein [Rhizobium sp. FY34]